MSLVPPSPPPSRLTRHMAGGDTRLLASREDRYDGIIVDSQSLQLDADVFEGMLRESLVQWAAQGKRGVWLKVPATHAALVPIAIQAGFEYHHAERSHVMLTRWLPPGTPSTLPLGASHQVGIGAFVLNDQRQVRPHCWLFCARECV
eukprot:jgi/Mesen1/8500/ME000480S07863